MLFFCLQMIQCNFIHLVLLITVGLDNACREIQRKTMQNEVTVYFYFLYVNPPQYIPINNKNNCNKNNSISSEMEIDFIPTHKQFLVVSQSQPLNLLKLLGNWLLQEEADNEACGFIAAFSASQGTQSGQATGLCNFSGWGQGNPLNENHALLPSPMRKQQRGDRSILTVGSNIK